MLTPMGLNGVLLRLDIWDFASQAILYYILSYMFCRFWYQKRKLIQYYISAFANSVFLILLCFTLYLRYDYNKWQVTKRRKKKKRDTLSASTMITYIIISFNLHSALRRGILLILIFKNNQSKKRVSNSINVNKSQHWILSPVTMKIK